MFSRFRSGVSDLMGSMGITKSGEHKKLRAAILEQDEEKAMKLYQAKDKDKDAGAGNDNDGKKSSKTLIDPSQPFPTNNAKKIGDTTPLHLASEYGMQQLCSAFLANGGNPNTLNLNLQTCLHSLCSSPDQLVARIAILHNFMSWNGNLEGGYTEALSINRVDADGNSAIHYAAENGISPIVRSLVAAGAIISIVNKSQKTCCELAESKGFYQLSSILELALLFQPEDEGMQAFQRAQRSTGSFQPPIFCLDCRSLTSDDVENHMFSVIQGAAESLKQSTERAEALLMAYDWDLQALISDYEEDKMGVMKKARLSVEVVQPKLPDSKKFKTPEMNAHSQPKPAQESESLLNEPVAAAETTQKNHDSQELFNPETCTDLAVLRAEEQRLRADNDISAAVLMDMRIETVEAEQAQTADKWKLAADDEVAATAAQKAAVVVVESHAAEQTKKAKVAEEEGPMCMICCESMVREADFNQIMEQAAVLLSSGRDEHELCIADTSDGCSLTCAAGHSFCVSCWAQHVTSKVRDEGFADLACPGFKCGETLNKRWAPFLLMDTAARSKAGSVDAPSLSDLPDSSSSLQSSLLGRFRRARILRFIDCNRACQNCQMPGCSMVLLLPTQQLQHPSTQALAEPLPQIAFCGAGHTMCMLCRKEGHAPCSCSEWEQWHAVLDKEMEVSGSTSSGNGKGKSSLELANDLWFTANTKKCPRCSTPIQKDDGCNHMVCGKCRHDFCWMCMEKWSLHNNSTGGYFQCNKYVEKGLDASDGMTYSGGLEKGSSRAETVRLQMNANRMARLIHHFTRYSAHADSAQREFAMRLETLQRIEYSLDKTARGDLIWLHEGRIQIPANVDVNKRNVQNGDDNDMPKPRNASISQVRAPVEGMWESISGLDDATPSKTQTPPRRQSSGTLGAKVSKAASALSRWFSPSKVREYGPATDTETAKTRAVSLADAEYASQNFSTTNGEVNDGNEQLLRTDGPSYLRFLRDGFDELARARQFLRGSYAHAYFAFDASAQNQNWRYQSRLMDIQTMYEALQGELELLVEMLSDVLARRRLRASQFQVIQLTDSVRAKRIEMEESVLMSAIQGQSNTDLRVPSGMTSLSAHGALPRAPAQSTRRGGNTRTNAFRGERSTRPTAAHDDEDRGDYGLSRAQIAAGLNDEELMDMVSIIAQLQSSESEAMGTEKEELNDLLKSSLAVLKDNGFVNPDIGSGANNTSVSAGSDVTRQAAAAAGAGAGPGGDGDGGGSRGSLEFVMPPTPPAVKVRAQAKATDSVRNSTRKLSDSFQMPPPGFISAQSAQDDSDEISSSDEDQEDEKERPIRVGGSPGRAAVPASMKVSTSTSTPSKSAETSKSQPVPTMSVTPVKSPTSPDPAASPPNKSAGSVGSYSFPSSGETETSKRNSAERRSYAPARERERALSDDRRVMEEEVELQNALFQSMRRDVVHVPSAVAASQENIDLLVQMMEVTPERAERALMQNGHNIEAAINSLLSDGD